MSRSTRSRAVSLPRDRCRSTAFSPPPRETSSVRSRSSATSASMRSARRAKVSSRSTRDVRRATPGAYRPGTTTAPLPGPRRSGASGRSEPAPALGLALVLLGLRQGRGDTVGRCNALAELLALQTLGLAGLRGVHDLRVHGAEVLRADVLRLRSRRDALAEAVRGPVLVVGLVERLPAHGRLLCLARGRRVELRRLGRGGREERGAVELHVPDH